MALVLNLKAIEFVSSSKQAKFAKCTFRGFLQQTKPVETYNDTVYYGETMQWPVCRAVEKEEMISIRIFTIGKYKGLPKKLYGSFEMPLQAILESPNLKFAERLLDSNQQAMEDTLSFELQYTSPDGGELMWDPDEFNYPLLDQWMDKEMHEQTAYSSDDFPRTIEDMLDGLEDEANDNVDASEVLRQIERIHARGDAEDGDDSSSDDDDDEPMDDFTSLLGKTGETPTKLEPTLEKMSDYQCSVMVMKMKVNKGFRSDLKSYVSVTCDNITHDTPVKTFTTTPEFHEYFVFDFHTSKTQLMDKVVTITAIASGRSIPGIRSGQKIGSFKIDLGTVYNAPEHMFFHKWAVLIDPDNLASGHRGYLKLDIILTGRGETQKSMPKMIKDYDEDDIEANLLLPVGMTVERQPCEVVVKIHRAEDMPIMYNAVMANVRRAIIGESDLADPFVKVSFCGMTGKTHVVDGNYNPIWNEQIAFRETFPPLCNRIRLQLYDHDTISDDVIATHYIDLAQIMHSGDMGGFTPQMGPCWINLYGAPRGQTLTDKHDVRNDLNNGFGEGCSYRGRVMLTVKADMLDEGDDGEALAAGVWTTPSPPVSQNVCGRKDDFTFFLSIFDASMISEDVVEMKKPVYFEVSIGNFGNTLDDIVWDAEIESPPDQRKKSEAICYSTTPPLLPVTSDQMHYRLPIDDEKPALYLVFPWEDNRKRMFNTNMLEGMAEKFARYMQKVKDSLSRESSIAIRQMKRGCKLLRKDIQQYLVYSRSVSGGAVKTKLDKDRNRLCEMSMDRIASTCKRMGRQVNLSNIKQHLTESRGIIENILHLAREPQHSVADIIIWMICNKKRIAYVRIPAREIIYSSSEMEKGKNCSKMRTLFLRQPGKMGMNEMGWRIQGKILTYMWMGIDRGRKDYLVDLPSGFKPSNKLAKTKAEIAELPPTTLTYCGDKARFHLQAYIYQARALIGSDETGLSDPFARVICYDRSVTTKIIMETLSPAWDQHMSIEDITIYMSHKEITRNPPMVFIEVFDWDRIGKPEFIGRAICTPRLNYLEDEYTRPSLQWWDVYRGQSKAGELLAAFELVEVGESGELPEGCPASPLGPYMKEHRAKIPPPKEKDIPPLILKVPRGIRPLVSRYRLEVLFWGVREMSRLRLLSVNRPQVIIECAGTIIQSTTIKSAKEKPNFDNPVVHADLDLPENPLFWPPFMIRVVDKRSFGRTIVAGIHVVSYTQKFEVEGVKSQAHEYDGLQGSTEMAGGTVIDWQIQNGVVTTQEGSRAPSRALSRAGSFTGSIAPSINIVDETGRSRRNSDARSVMSRGSRAAILEPINDVDEVDADTRSLSMNFVPRTHGAELLPLDAQSIRSGRSRHSLLPDNRSVLSFSQAGDGFVNPAYEASEDDVVSQKNMFNKSPSRRGSLASSIGGLAPPGTISPGRLSQAPRSPALSKKSFGAASRKSFSAVSRKSFVASIKDVIIGSKEADIEKAELDEGEVPAGEGEEGEEEGEGGAVVAKTEIPKPSADLNKDTSPDDVEELDWWSKYYVTLEDVTKVKLRHAKKKELQGVSDDELPGGEGGEDDEDEEGGGGSGSASEDGLDKDEGKKGTDVKEMKSAEEMLAIKKKLRRERAKKLMGALNKIRGGDDDDGLVYEGEKKEDTSFIERLRFYSMDLESVSHYSGFKNWLKTFPLSRGKRIDDEEEDDARVVGYFKGSFCIYRVGKAGDSMPSPRKQDLRLNRSLPANDPAEVLIRLYIVRANDLHPSDPNGKADPYIVIRLGTRVISDKDNYVSKQLNPVFGKCFEIEATFPMESMLTIQIVDWDLLNKDDLIGQTRIDLENRFYSQHPGASCGIAKKYEPYGYNKWRDPVKPTQMLSKMCRDIGLPEPSYQPMLVKVGEQFFTGANQVKDESGEMKFSNEPLALEVIKQWHTVPNGKKIVPEHVETRSLYNPELPGVEQGKLEMWLDIFSKASAPAWPPVDIAPRLPKSYEVRIIVWNTDEVELNDVSILTGEASSDIYIKAWLKGTGDDDQSTDIHYNSMTGEGNFNWRFVFPFDYLKSEDKVVIKRKESFYSADETEYKIQPRVYIQCWDADLVSSDDYIGSLMLHLSCFPRGVKTAARCSMKQLATDGSVPQVSIFKNRKMKGWWPFVAMDSSSGEMELKGKAELEMMLLTKEEAEISPVGLGREEPDALPLPNRPKANFAWFTNPWIVFKNIIWKNFKWTILKCLCLALYICFLCLIIYSAPTVFTSEVGSSISRAIGR